MALTQVSTGGIKDGQVQTADLADGQVTVGKLHADALDRTYTLGADGSNHYTFTGEGLTGAVNDPTLYLTRGKTYRFVNGNSAGAHPFRIQTTVNGSAGTEYNTGVTNNGGAGGSTIVFEVPHDAPDVLYYQCTSHGAMGGILYVTGALADGTVTTAKLADDAVTDAKLANSINSAIAANTAKTSLEDDSVSTAKIQDDAVTDAKLANSINSAIAANTAKDLTALSASNLTSGTVPDARFPATLPAVSGANLTGISTTPADGSITQAKLNFPVANRNLVINGAFRVAQRGTSSNSTGFQTVDRFSNSFGGNSGNLTQDVYNLTAGSPDPRHEGFYKALRVTNAGQNADNAGYGYLYHPIEAQDVVSSGWRFGSSSSYLTLSFWIRTSVAQDYNFAFFTHDGTQKEYNFVESLSAGVWTKVVKTIPGDSGITINNDNGLGMQLYWYYYIGPNYTSGNSINQWQTHSGYTTRPDMANTWWTTSNATFEITGVQLEVGSVATDFEHRRYADELRSCQRYYFRDNTARYHYGNYGEEHYDFPVTLRANPTVTLVSVPTGGNVNRPRPNWVTITGMGSNYGNIEVIASAEL